MASTIADVAARAGVSTATVSRVLAGLGGATPATRQRVMTAARDLGYRPSGVARSLKLRTTKTLGLIVTDIANPYFPQLVRAVEDAALARQYVVLLCNAADDPEREVAYLELLAERRVDGLVVASSGVGERHASWLATAPVPVVLINTTAPLAGSALPAVLSDNRAGGRLAAEHVIGLGHRRIGHVTAPDWNTAAPERLAGIEDALTAAGLDPALTLAIAEGDGHVAGAESATVSLLDRPVPPTALLAYNDLSAIGAIRAVRARGLRVPEDVSVVGFDDVELAAYSGPPLTTVAQATAEMGHWAVERLVDGRRRPKDEPLVVRLPVRIVVRASTGPAPRVRWAAGSTSGRGAI
ncbi:MAG: LacI family DNA-binding transcriptional regulator [Chloroflexota bacterium]